MARMLSGLVLDPPLVVIVLGVAAIGRAMTPAAEVPVGSRSFADRDALLHSVLMAPPAVELVRHSDIPGCPGCMPDHGPCLATLTPIRP